MKIRRWISVCGLVLIGAGSAHAQDALVESATAGAPVVAFRFLTVGETFQLTSGQSIKIGYLSSCTSETITGGSVAIGKNQSAVTGGEVHRETLACGIDVALSQAERNESGASAWRNDPSRDTVIIGNLTPVLIFPSAPAMIKIERTDIPGRPIRLSGNAAATDLRERGVTLEAGGIYMISAGSERREVEVDFNAVTTGGPVFLRAVRF